MQIFLLIALIIFVCGCDYWSWGKEDKKSPVAFQSKKKASIKEIRTIADIQKALANAGYYKGSITGKPSPALSRAIRDFQAKNGLATDGRVGPKTKDKLKKFLP